MSREPGFPPPQPVEKVDNKLITEVRHYKLITPLYGGGVKPAIADPVTTIRATEVRGHLRFWWRATRGGGFDGDLQKMKEAEDLLWGAASTSKKPRPSHVQVEVACPSKGTDKQPFTVTNSKDKRGNPKSKIVEDDTIAPPYAAFPMRPEEKGLTSNTPIQNVKDGVNFVLTITYSMTNKADVEASLWAWETFGGIGARTRRGFGALQLTKILKNDVEQPVSCPRALEVGKYIREGLAQHIKEGVWPQNLPHLSIEVRRKVMDPQSDAMKAWSGLIEKYRQFRQKRTDGKYGESEWPEADAIRRIVGKARSQSDSALHATNPVDKFPRAQFGLPIIFHFKDTDDPDDTTLQGKNADRLTSPLILRPLGCTGGQAVGLALIMDAPSILPDGLILKGAPADPSVKVELTLPEARRVDALKDNTELRTKAQTVDILQAFLNSL